MIPLLGDDMFGSMAVTIMGWLVGRYGDHVGVYSRVVRDIL